MSASRLSTITVRVVAVAAGLGVLAWVWTRSDSAERPPPTDAWIKQLRALDVDDRKQALHELESASPAEITVVMPALLGALHDVDAGVRNEAALALSRFLSAALRVKGASLSERSRDAAASLAAFLRRDRDSGMCGSAAFASASLLCAARDAGIKPDPSKADDPIDPRTLARQFCALMERDPAARLAFLVPYETLGPYEEPAPAVVLAALDDPSQSVRIQALLVLSQYARGVDAAVPALLKEAATLDSRAEPSRVLWRTPLRRAAERLHATVGVIPLLVKGLDSRNLDERAVTVLLLERLGPDARSAGAALTAATRAMIRSSETSTKPSENPIFANFAAALARVLPADEAVALLREAASPGHAAIQSDAIWALGKLGPQAAAAIPTLLEALEFASRPGADPAREAVIVPAILSLGKIAPGASLSDAMATNVVKAVSRGLDSPHYWVRAEAANALGEFAAGAASALPRLGVLKESDNEQVVRDAASKAIARIESNP